MNTEEQKKIETLKRHIRKLGDRVREQNLELSIMKSKCIKGDCLGCKLKIVEECSMKMEELILKEKQEWLRDAELENLDRGQSDGS